MFRTNHPEDLDDPNVFHCAIADDVSADRMSNITIFITEQMAPRGLVFLAFRVSDNKPHKAIMYCLGRTLYARSIDETMFRSFFSKNELVGRVRAITLRHCIHLLNTSE